MLYRYLSKNEGTKNSPSIMRRGYAFWLTLLRPAGYEGQAEEG
jgi:hypothetical protein